MTDARLAPVHKHRVSFTNEDGEQLSAALETPVSNIRAYALFAHCFTCSKDIAAASRISHALAAKGFAVLRFDFTGLGNSEGDFANTNFTSNVEDLIRAADYLRSHYQAPELLIGHSLGGSAVLAAAPRIPEVKAVATIGSPSDPAHIRHLFSNDLEKIEETGCAVVRLGTREFAVKRQFLDDIAAHKLTDDIGAIGKALLIFHSPTDDIVNIEHARRIFQAAQHPKSFVSLDKADHLLSRREDSQYVADTIAAWAGRYLLGESEAQETMPVAPLAPGQVQVRESDKAFSRDILAGSHYLRADEPRGVGGADTGPNPYDLLLASLGSCISMTVRMYANRKRLPLDEVTVTLAHRRIHAEDCEHCETKEGKLDHIEVELDFRGPLNATNRARLLEIAHKCPVHRTLKSEVDIRQQLTEGSSANTNAPVT
jgi:putative redox protein